MLTTLLLFAFFQSSFNVEKLTPTEQHNIEVARKRFAAAQADLEEVEDQIKYAHGQTRNSLFTFATCLQGSTEVELKGDWALITSETHNVCDNSFESHPVVLTLENAHVEKAGKQ